MFRCHVDGKPVGQTVSIDLEEGDIYMMSEHAVGERWRSKGAHWLHAAGSAKYAMDPMALWTAKQAARARKKAKRDHAREDSL